MLQQITIKNIVLIDNVTINFTEGLCVLTGETGAGKSILLDSLGLAIGNRAESRLVRQGEKQGTVTAIFDFNNNKNLINIFEEYGIEITDEIYLRRVLYSDGKSKAFVNDNPVSANVLQKIASTLIEIHGQHGQKDLLNINKHMRMLDEYANSEKLLNITGKSFKKWKNTEQEYNNLVKKFQLIQKEEEYLRHSLAELESLSPAKGEEEELASKRTEMMNFEKTIDILKDALSSLVGKNDIAHSIRTAERILDRAVHNVDNDMFEPALEALNRAGIEVQESISVIENIFREMEFEQDDLESTEERLFALKDASRKYNKNADDLVDYISELKKQIQMIDSDSNEIDILKQKTNEAREEYINNATKLSDVRRDKASMLIKDIHSELAPLKMGNSEFKIDINNLDEESWSAKGIDKVEFLIKTNPGSPFSAIGKTASGGELSRLMLALKVVVSGNKTTTSMIFDEIDTGIGGATADAVGKRLNRLGENAQILCVTHHPQVAAYGNLHLYINKKIVDDKMTTNVITLESNKRIEELARMLAGENISDEARAAAKKLLLGSAA